MKVLRHSISLQSLQRMRKHYLFVIHGSGLEGVGRVLSNLVNTGIHCQDEVKPGYYHEENKFVIVLDQVRDHLTTVQNMTSEIGR